MDIMDLLPKKHGYYIAEVNSTGKSCRWQKVDVISDVKIWCSLSKVREKLTKKLAKIRSRPEYPKNYSPKQLEIWDEFAGKFSKEEVVMIFPSVQAVVDETLEEMFDELKDELSKKS